MKHSTDDRSEHMSTGASHDDMRFDSSNFPSLNKHKYRGIFVLPLFCPLKYKTEHF